MLIVAFFEAADSQKVEAAEIASDQQRVEDLLVMMKQDLNERYGKFFIEL